MGSGAETTRSISSKRTSIGSLTLRESLTSARMFIQRISQTSGAFLGTLREHFSGTTAKRTSSKGKAIGGSTTGDSQLTEERQLFRGVQESGGLAVQGCKVSCRGIGESRI